MKHEIGFHFHVGPARIADGVLNDPEIAEIVKKAKPSTYLVNNREFKSSLRHCVNSNSELDFRKSLQNPKVVDVLNKFDNFKQVIFSQHAVLGHPKSILKQGKILPGAEDRLGKISELFAQHELTYHITIANQYNYFRTLLDELSVFEIKKNISFQIPSWYELICRLLPHCDGAQVVVWDFSLPNKLAVPFAQSVLDLDPKDIPEGTQTKILDNSCEHLKISSIADRAVPIFTQTEANGLRQMYDNDLINISQHPDLILVNR